MVKNWFSPLAALFLTAAITSGAYAGPEVSVAGIHDRDTEERTMLTTFGVEQGPVFSEIGFRSESAIQIVTGFNFDFERIQFRTGALYVHGHEESYRFAEPYGMAEDDGSGLGGMAEVGVNVGQRFTPFVRYQGFSTHHEFMANRRVGTDSSGSPKFGDPVTMGTDRWTNEVVAGLRVEF